MSDEEWNFKAKDDLIYIKNISKTKTLQAYSNRYAWLSNSEEDQAEQLWKKGDPNAEGYFILENSSVPKVLTATSSSDLKIQGNITLRLINITNLINC